MPADAEVPAVDPNEGAAPITEPDADEAEENPEDEGDGEDDGEGGDAAAAQQVDDDSEEVSHGGKTYRIPKELAPVLKDGMTSAEKATALAAQEAAHNEAVGRFQRDVVQQRASVKEIAQLIQIDAQIGEFNKLDWPRIEAEQPLEAQRLFREFTLLKEQGLSIYNGLVAKQQQAEVTAQTQFRERSVQTQAVLAREIPNWNDSAKQMTWDYGLKAGLSADEIGKTTDARLIKILHKAALWDAHESKSKAGVTVRRTVTPAQAAAAATPAAAAVQPVTTVNARRAPAPNIPRDSDTPEIWLKKRNAQLRRRMGAGRVNGVPISR